jgi:hypothetical protein
VPVNVSLGDGLPRLGYTTSAVLERRDFGGRKLLVLYGEDAAEGELRLDGGFGPDGEAPQILANALEGFSLDVHERGLWVMHYIHADDRPLVVRYPSGEELEILVTTRDEAGFWWFGKDAAGRDLALSDAAYVERAVSNGSARVLDVWRRPGSGGAQMLTPVRPADIRGPLDETVSLDAWDPVTWLLPLWPFQPKPQAETLPALPALEDLVALAEDDLPNERAPGFDFAAHGPAAVLAGGPAELEAPEIGVLRGHAWYATSFDAGGGPAPAAADLRIEGAGDFVATYVNGVYAGTVAPVGAPEPPLTASPDFTGDALHLPIDPALLLPGANDLAFRVQVWGHGEAYLPTLVDVQRVLDEFAATYGFPLPLDLNLVLPSLMFYSYRGLWGADDATADYVKVLMPFSDPAEPAAARAEIVLDGVPVPLDGTWTVTAGEEDGPGGVLDGAGRLLGERLGFTEPDFDADAFAADPQWAASFAPAALPVALSDGGTVWLRAEFDTDDVPRAAAGAILPLALRLGGRSLTAVVWLNGRMIGRWISDTDWLTQGAPVPAVRDTFVPPGAPRDELPLAGALLAPPGGRNVLVVALEDQSPPGDADADVVLRGTTYTVTGIGALDTLELVLAGQDLRDGSALLYAKDRFILTGP